mmetsp:Transcript_48264/g.112940  ORF Transcript_48264/g.112940 Transcript_48264/m.112940 type:complete len:646 (-) Transcript_48264:67-2004(-)
MAPKTLISSQSGTGAGPCKRRQLHRRSSEDIIQRALDEHFPTFTQLETDGILRGSPPRTLRQRLRFERAESEVKNFRFAPSLLQQLRQDYAAEDSVQNKLKVAKEEETVDPDLITAMATLQHKNKALASKEPLYSYLETSTTLNQKELIGIFRHIHSLNLHWPASRTHAMRLLGYLTEKNLHVKFVDDFANLAGRWDELLTLSYGAARKNGVDLQKWWSQNKVACQVFSAHLSLAKVMGESESWTNVLEELNYLTEKTLLGKKMLSSVAAAVGVDSFSAKLVQEVAEFEKKTFTAEAFTRFQAKTETLLQAAARISKEARKREITLVYRGKEIKVEVESLRGELTKRIACMIKSMAAGTNELPALEWEKEIFNAPSKETSDVCSRFLKKFAAAREAAAEVVKVDEGLTYQDLLHRYGTRREYLLEIDSSFVIEEKILQYVAEGGARARLQEKLLAVLPTETKRMALDEVAEQMESLHSSWLVKLLTPGDRAVLTTCEEILGRMRRSQSQSFAALKDAGFMTQWLDRLKFFLNYELKSEKGEKLLVGDKALRQLVEEKLKDEYIATSFSDLNELHAFSYMLSESEHLKLKQKTAQYLETTQGIAMVTPVPAEKRRAACKSNEKGNKKQKVKSCDEEAHDAAKQLFM